MPTLKTIVANLGRAQQGLLRAADEVPANQCKRFHVPMAVVESRLIRRKTPIATDDAMIRGKEEMLTGLREVRKNTLEFIGKTTERDLSKYRMPHPFLGTLNSYAWLQLIASHEVRHTEQMKEIGGALPKVVAILQK